MDGFYRRDTTKISPTTKFCTSAATIIFRKSKDPLTRHWVTVLSRQFLPIGEKRKQAVHVSSTIHKRVRLEQGTGSERAALITARQPPKKEKPPPRRNLFARARAAFRFRRGARNPSWLELGFLPSRQRVFYNTLSHRDRHERYIIYIFLRKILVFKCDLSVCEGALFPGFEVMRGGGWG